MRFRVTEGARNAHSRAARGRLGMARASLTLATGQGEASGDPRPGPVLVEQSTTSMAVARHAASWRAGGVAGFGADRAGQRGSQGRGTPPGGDARRIPARQIYLQLIGNATVDGAATVSTAACRAAACEALRMGTPYSRWLLIYDNVADVRQLRPYLPGGGRARHHHLPETGGGPQVAFPVEVRGFTPAEGERYIRDRVPALTSAEARKGQRRASATLPLAVVQAAAWLRNTGMDVVTYLEAARQGVHGGPGRGSPRRLLLARGQHMEHLSFQQLAHSSQAAARDCCEHVRVPRARSSGTGPHLQRRDGSSARGVRSRTGWQGGSPQGRARAHQLRPRASRPHQPHPPGAPLPGAGRHPLRA